MDEQIIDLDRRLSIFNTPVYIRSADCSSQRESRGAGSYSFIKLYYNTEGTSVITLNYTDKIIVDKNGWVLIDRGVIYSETVYGRCSGYVLRIFTDPKGSSLFPALSRNRYCFGEDEGEIGELLRRIKNESGARARGYSEYCECLLTELMIRLCRMCGDSGISSGESKKAEKRDDAKVIDDFFNRVYSYDKEELTIEKLADRLYMSERNVSRILKKRYGMTFQELLLSARMRFAAYLLLQSDRKVSEISILCDMSEPYFIKCFNKIYGSTPARYRKINRK